MQPVVKRLVVAHRYVFVCLPDEHTAVSPGNTQRQTSCQPWQHATSKHAVSPGNTQRQTRCQPWQHATSNTLSALATRNVKQAVSPGNTQRQTRCQPWQHAMSNTLSALATRNVKHIVSPGNMQRQTRQRPTAQQASAVSALTNKKGCNPKSDCFSTLLTRSAWPLRCRL